MTTSFTVLRTLAARWREDRPALVLALALPVVFLHRNYNPALSFGSGSTSAEITLADLGVLAVVVAGAVAARRGGIRPWAAGRVPLGLSLAFLVWIGVSLVYAATRESWYPAATHAQTAARYLEYALLAFAIPLIVRRTSQLVPAAAMLAAWSVAATVVGLLQFLGVLGDLDQTPAGRRKPSFLGYHDFATMSALALSLAAVIYVCRVRAPGRALVAAAVAAGLGMILGGPLGVMVGSLLALVALLVLARLRFGLGSGRAAVLAGVWLAVLGGVVLIRSSTIDQGLRFVGIKPKTTASSGQIQSYAHRSLLAYLGFRIWLDHPLLGVGWQASADPPAYERYLADAHRRFDQPASAFPSAERRWGVQNAYVQALADLGAVGFLLLAALLVSAVVLGARLVLRGPPSTVPAALWGTLALLVVAGIWNDVGLIAAIPIEASLWIAIGTLVAAAAMARGEGRAGER